MKVGLFGGTEYPAWVRFSSDTLPSRNDWTTTCGIAIKLFNAPTPKIFGEALDNTFDIILQNINVFFVDTAQDFCEFTQASLGGREAFEKWRAAHKRPSEILDQMRTPVASCLGTAYWSCVPFAFGPERYVKYKLAPAKELVSPAEQPSNPTYLAQDLRERLAFEEQRFTFLVQFRTDPATMPLDAATVEWPESQSPYVPIAELVLPPQDVADRGQSDYGENLSWNIWRVNQAHRPQGSVAEARLVVYAASAELRRNTNGIPNGEPAGARPDMEDAPCTDQRIAYAKVHPGIGVARVGDAETEFFLSPETNRLPNRPGDYYRDETGALKREAQRFRLYGYNAAGEVVTELTSDNADITWTVHLANRKADWFQFVTAMDVPETRDLVVARRNPDELNRERLVIDPGPRSITGANVSGGTEHAFDSGEFKGIKVPLGELQTDKAGRLIVLGGHGKSASPSGKDLVNPGDPNWFNNSNDWYDDTSDGPVTAHGSDQRGADPCHRRMVLMAQTELYAPIIGWRTIYDLMTDTAIEAGLMEVPAITSFQKDVLPQLARLSNLQWVNKGFAAKFGFGRPMDFQVNVALLDKLATAPYPDPDRPSANVDPYAELRRTILHSFRPYTMAGNDPRIWPWLYGDTFDLDLLSATSPRTMLQVPSIQLLHLERWVAGRFEGGYDPNDVAPQTLKDVPLAEQPAMLDKAALYFCLADAFHPGCEMTWPMRHSTLYSEPYRIRPATGDLPVPTSGATLSQDQALAPDGPLTQQEAGGISRWMGLPWQGDTAYCRAGYMHDYDPSFPPSGPRGCPTTCLRWPITRSSLTRPNRGMRASLPSTGVRAANRFMDAVRKPGDGPEVVMEEMVKTFGQQGLVAPLPAPKAIRISPTCCLSRPCPPRAKEGP